MGETVKRSSGGFGVSVVSRKIVNRGAGYHSVPLSVQTNSPVIQCHSQVLCAQSDQKNQRIDKETNHQKRKQKCQGLPVVKASKPSTQNKETKRRTGKISKNCQHECEGTSFEHNSAPSALL